MRSLKTLWMRIFTTFYRRVMVLSQPLASAPDPSDAKLALTVEILPPEQIDQYVQFRPSQAEEAVIRSARGDLVAIAWHQNRVVGSCWIATHRAPIPYVDRDILLPPDAIYIYDAFTAPEYRGNEISRTRSAHVAAEFIRRGYARSLAVVALENASGRKSAHKAGYRPLGVHTVIRLGPLRIRRDQKHSEEYPAFTRSVPPVRT